MRMHAIIVVEPFWQMVDDSLCVGSRADAGVFSFESLDESFGNSVALRTFDRRGAWCQADVAREAPCILGSVAAAVIRQPFDGVGELGHLAEAMRDVGNHEVAHILGGDAADSGYISHRLPVAAVESEGDADLRAIVVSDLEAVRTPACIAGDDGDLAVMPAFLAASGMALEQ